MSFTVMCDDCGSERVRITTTIDGTEVECIDCGQKEIK